MISDACISNCGSLLNKIININMKNKSLTSLDIKSLYTNITVAKCIKHLENHIWKTNVTLPLPVSKLITICTLCISHCYFQLNKPFYKQKFVLPVGSLLSGILTCIYLGFLDSGPFKYTIPSNSNYFYT